MIQSMPSSPRASLDKLMNSQYMNIAVFIAIGIALVIWVVMNRTTFGYELKACGYNRHASDYAGLNAKRSIIYSMTIAGGLAGIGGGLYFLSGTAQFTLVKALLTMGFNGIPVALLAGSNPIGTIFSALFISYIQVGGDALQPEYAKEIIDIIIAAIIYLSAFAMLMRGWIGKLFIRRQRKLNRSVARDLPPWPGRASRGANEHIDRAEIFAIPLLGPGTCSSAASSTSPWSIMLVGILPIPQPHGKAGLAGMHPQLWPFWRF